MIGGTSISFNNIQNQLDELQKKLPEIYSILAHEAPVVKPDAEQLMVVGDIHGNFEALKFILKTKEEYSIDTIVFLGDYVDRGSKSIEVLNRLFDLKLELPEDIILLRGNHETMPINRFYGLFYDTGADEELFTRINLTFNRLPLAAVISDTTFCVHGGIPESSIIEDITKEDYFPYVWNDPSEKNGMNPSNRGSGVQTFGKDIVMEFLDRNRMNRIIRGHEYIYTGYMWWFDNKLLSIFSCPNYMGMKNDGALAVLDKDELEILTFR